MCWKTKRPTKSFKALKTVRVATDDPMAIRQLILLGVRAEKKDNSFENVEGLLEHWTGMQRPEKAATIDAALAKVVRQNLSRSTAGRTAQRR